MNAYSPFHPHEPDVPPIFGPEGRCLVCAFAVRERQECEEDRDRLREVIRQFLEAYTWPARNRNMLEVQRLALEAAKAALEGRDGTN